MYVGQMVMRCLFALPFALLATGYIAHARRPLVAVESLAGALFPAVLTLLALLVAGVAILATVNLEGRSPDVKRALRQTAKSARLIALLAASFAVVLLALDIGEADHGQSGAMGFIVLFLTLYAFVLLLTLILGLFRAVTEAMEL